jgi:hypothetical protein
MVANPVITYVGLTPEKVDWVNFIYDKYGGFGLTPEQLLDEAAADPASPLHDDYQWDDAIAGHLHRVEQSRGYLRKIYAEAADKQGKIVYVRAFSAMDVNLVKATLPPNIQIVTLPSRDKVYIRTMQAIQQPILRQDLIRQGQEMLRRFKAIYGHLEEFIDIIDSINKQPPV